MHIDIPTCSTSCVRTQDNRLIKWKSTPNTTRYILQLASRDAKNFDEKVRSHYGIAGGEGFVIRVHIPRIPIEDIDYGWEVRMLYLFTKYLELERLMWKMSTLGGACSAMADYDISFARRAGDISEMQLRIAAELDDRTLLARCYLYIALSEAQQARFDEARKILRSVYAWSQRTKNEFIEHCCFGVLAKIRSIEIFGTHAIRSNSSTQRSIQK
ncbi:hypothetical protein KIN20_034228 [Parelaphostrongylus tenuis]|uniref:Uncharacterized protein n=1 Tax=Parelaphostrongylus tenuis TaxID=148309 RepID=A0AAD5RC25_PARTN|nr:hypothetical protein KIN20_034228 [Parelaphostrongylus tenuis]